MRGAARPLACGLLLCVTLPGLAATAAPGDPDWHIPVPPDSATAPVPHPAFQRLEAALDRYEAIVDAGGWPTQDGDAVLAPGMRDPGVAALRARLRISGDYRADMGADPWLFDASLGKALESFQIRHGLAPTGVLDRATREQANVTAAERRDQLAVTLERWRWLPRALGERYIWVNIPAANLQLIENGVTVVSMRTVVGHPARPTPSLKSDINRVEFQPAWYVPRSIAVEDLLPMQKQDPEFLVRQRIRVFRGDREVDPRAVDWGELGAARFPYRLVQDAGPGNSLGRVKFVMANPFDIFLHDTPAKGFFSLRSRLLSAGCVRLGDPLALAVRILGEDQGWAAEKTAALLAGDATRSVALRERLPVFLVYLTAWVATDGVVHFRRDVYGRDARLRDFTARQPDDPDEQAPTTL